MIYKTVELPSFLWEKIKNKSPELILEAVTFYKENKKKLMRYESALELIKHAIDQEVKDITIIEDIRDIATKALKEN